mgnify:CR=1 FL=1
MNIPYLPIVSTFLFVILSCPAYAVDTQPFEGDWAVGKTITGGISNNTPMDQVDVLMHSVDLATEDQCFIIRYSNSNYQISIASPSKTTMKQNESIQNIQYNANEMSFIVSLIGDGYEFVTRYRLKLTDPNHIEGVWKEKRSFIKSYSSDVLNGTLIALKKPPRKNDDQIFDIDQNKKNITSQQNTAKANGTTTAQDDERRLRIAKYIEDSANRLCASTPIDAQGEASKLELNSSQQLELNNLLKKLLNVGIDASEKYSTSRYKGVLQKDIAQILHDRLNCMTKLIPLFYDRLLPNN